MPLTDDEKRGLRLGVEQEKRLRAWPKDRIRPKSVALGVLSLLAEVTALRTERDVALAQVVRLRAAGDALHAELLDLAFGWDLGLPERCQVEARAALDAWRALADGQGDAG